MSAAKVLKMFLLCHRVFLQPLPSPSPAVVPSPIPPTPSPSPAPGKLSLVSELPPNYPGVDGGNLTATGPDTCVQAPSPVLGIGGVTITAPGAGQCNGPSGTMPPGSYNLTQTAPPGLIFVGWTCYDTTSGSPIIISVLPSTNLPSGASVTCKAKYEYPPSPSPGVSPR
jgi:hypothetical protein